MSAESPQPSDFDRPVNHSPGLRPGLAAPGTVPDWVFEQHLVWVDRRGDGHEIESMAREYAAAVIGFCRQHAPRFFLARLRHDGDRLASAEGSELAELTLALGELLGYLDAADSILGDAAEAWLEERPLLQALRRRAGR